jgi:rhamnose transport system permease protein
MSADVVTGPATRSLPGLVRSRDVGIGAVVVLVAAAFGLAQPNFFRPENLFAIVVSIGILLVMAVGQMFVIVTRQIDLSIGSTLGLAAMVMAMVGRDLPGTPLPVLVPRRRPRGGRLRRRERDAGDAGRGATDHRDVGDAGHLPRARVPRLGQPPGQPVGGAGQRRRPGRDGLDPRATAAADRGRGRRRRLVRRRAVDAGLRVYAVGSNPEAAAARGLRPKTTSFMVFVAMGCLAGLAGVLYVARYGTVNPADVGLGWELTVISAVVIGGTNIFGGSGTVSGVVLGCLLVGVLSNGLTVIGVSGFWQQAAEGAIILVAVIVDTFVRRRAQNSQSTRKRA